MGTPAERSKKYSKTEKGRKTQKKYRESAKGKKSRKRYKQSEKGKISLRKYNQSEKGRAVAKRFSHSKFGKKQKTRQNLKDNYGLTLEQYDKMVENQNGVCMICSGMNVDGRRLAVDHNHKTGEIRALLCLRCNVELGIYENGKGKFENYLRSFK